MYIQIESGSKVSVITSNGDVRVFEGGLANEIIEIAKSGLPDREDKINELISRDINAKDVAAEKLVQLSTHISYANGQFFYNGEPVHPSIDHFLADAWKETNGDVESMKPISLMLERLYMNTSMRVRDQLIQWLSTHFVEGGKIAINSDGRFIGHKGVQMLEYNGEMTPHSINEGEAEISLDGGVTWETHNGAIPYPDGCIARMARSKVQDDPNVGCSYGLHVGNRAYASGFGHGHIITVLVAPEDVVSVPNDCGYQKLRAERFESVGVSEVVNVINDFASFDVDDIYGDDDYDDDYFYEDEDDDFEDDEDGECDCADFDDHDDDDDEDEGELEGKVGAFPFRVSFRI